jgi:molybdopterin-guanine dinucleotide biosynthesis protein A
MATRFSGKPKALLPLGRQCVLDYIFRVYQAVFDDIVLVANDPVNYQRWDALIVSDLFPYRSSLTGIHTGLFHCRHPYAFVSACDTPFLRTETVTALICAVEPGVDVVIPETAAGVEPLCAVYSARCLHAIERSLQQKQFKIQQIFNSVKVRKIPEADLRQTDPDLRCFFNINTPEDLAAAERLLAESSRKPEG